MESEGYKAETLFESEPDSGITENERISSRQTPAGKISELASQLYEADVSDENIPDKDSSIENEVISPDPHRILRMQVHSDAAIANIVIQGMVAVHLTSGEDEARKRVAAILLDKYTDLPLYIKRDFTAAVSG